MDRSDRNFTIFKDDKTYFPNRIDPHALDYSKLGWLVNTWLRIEKTRVATQVRDTHLKKRNRICKTTEEVLKHLIAVEERCAKEAKELIQSHPAYYWFCRVKGIGLENIGKVIGPFLMIDPETGEDKAPHISSFWQFAGYGMEKDKNEIQKRRKGKKITYNKQVKTMCWRLCNGLTRARARFYDYYISQKEMYTEKHLSRGEEIWPSAKLPKDSRGKKYEPEGVVSLLHVNNEARRKTIKLFLACFWLTWREAEGLPVTEPYAIKKLGHTHKIDPWYFAEQKEKKIPPFKVPEDEDEEGNNNE